MSKKKLNIFLDLDQTIISAEPVEKDEDDFIDMKDKATMKKMKLYKWHDMSGFYVIFERPNLQSFLDFLFENFNVSVWTAATKSYALFIIEKIIMTKPERQLEYIFFKEHCDYSYRNGKKTKNLSVLWSKYKNREFSCDNTFILDDYDEVYDTQPNNCIRAVPFFFKRDKSHQDKFLDILKSQLEKCIEKQDLSCIKTINNEVYEKLKTEEYCDK
jgi:TFIIF-interacting CTD phosphatase-like protein